MSWLMIVIIVESLLLIWWGVALFKFSNRIDYLEDRILYVNDEIIDTLSLMRELDNREMFEKDDEVGQLWEQITLIIGDLRYIVYGEKEEEEEPLLDRGN